MPSEWANKMVLANSIGEGWSLGEMDFIARMLDAARKHGRSESLAEIVELRRDKERLDWLLSPNAHQSRIAAWLWGIATELCPIDYTEADKTEKWGRAAIDAARKGEPK